MKKFAATNELLAYVENMLRALKNKRYTSSSENGDILELSRLVNKANGKDYGTLFFVESQEKIVYLDRLINFYNSIMNDEFDDVQDAGFKYHNGIYCQVIQGPLNKIQRLLEDLKASKATIVELVK